MHELKLDTTSNLLVHTNKEGQERRYRPLNVSAIDMFEMLRDMAAVAPDQVLGVLEAGAQLVEPDSLAKEVPPADPNPTPAPPGEPEVEESSAHVFTEEELRQAFSHFLDRLELDHGNDREQMYRHHLAKLEGKTLAQALAVMPRGPRGAWSDMMSDIRAELKSIAQSTNENSAPASTSSTVSGNIPYTATRSSNPYTPEEDAITNQPKSVDRSKGGEFKEERAGGARAAYSAGRFAGRNSEPRIQNPANSFGQYAADYEAGYQDGKSAAEGEDWHNRQRALGQVRGSRRESTFLTNDEVDQMVEDALSQFS